MRLLSAYLSSQRFAYGSNEVVVGADLLDRVFVDE